MSEVLSQPVVHALARALGHFVWQGAAIGLVTLVAFRLLRSSANARYLVGVTGLAAMLIAPIVTLVLLNEAESGTAVAASIAPGTTAAPVGFAEQVSTAAIAAVKRPVEIDWLAVAVVAWMIGAMGFALRLAGGWIVARRYVTRAVEPASEQLVDLVHDLSTRMGIPSAIAIVQSSAVSVPVLIGWLKPTIVLPIAALASLTPSQVEALIAHELAHVRRHDYFVNLLQSVVEALLFYHPAVWWLSRHVRAERELCCDDLAVGVCDRLVYATALTDLAAMAPTGVALAATDGDLLARVRRILGRETSAGRPGATPLVAIALVAAIVGPAALASATQPQHPLTGSHSAIDPQTHDALHQQTTPTPSPVAQSQADKERELLKKHAELSKKLAEQNQEVQKKHLEAVRKSVDDMQHIEAMQKAELHAQAVKTLDQAHVAQEAQAKDLAAEYARMRELFQRGLVSQAQLQAAKDQLADAQAKTSQAAHDLQTKDLLAQVERTKQLYERGLATQAQLQAVEAKLEQAKSAQGNDEMAALRAKLQQAEIELQRAKTLFDKGLMTAATVADLEQAVAELKKKIGGTDEALVAREVAPEKSQQTQPALQTQTFYLKKASVSEVAQILNQMLSGAPGPRPTITTDSAAKSLTVTGSDAMLALVKNIVASADGVKSDPAEQEKAAQLSPKTRIQYLDAPTLLKVGDIVNLTFIAEPSLARMYPVGDDGMIRVPFMGPLKVVGLNANQIREGIGKWMAEHKLGSVDQVTVQGSRVIK